MKRLAGCWILILTAVALSGACGGTISSGQCTAIGCDSGVAITLSDLDVRPGRNHFDVRACFDGDCRRTVGTVGRNGSNGRYRVNDLGLFLLDGDIRAMLPLRGQGWDETTEHRVEVAVRVNGGEPIHVEQDVTLQRNAPNGERCGPICWQARVEG